MGPWAWKPPRTILHLHTSQVQYILRCACAGIRVLRHAHDCPYRLVSMCSYGMLLTTVPLRFILQGLAAHFS